MSTIVNIKAWEVLDSRGNPTVCAEVGLSSGVKGRAVVPSGASTGTYEAVEKRDGDGQRFLGKGVQGAIQAITATLSPQVRGVNACDQTQVDDILRAADGTENFSNLGANAVLGLSLAVAHAAAAHKGVALLQHVATLGQFRAPCLPIPLLNVLNGGAHADNGLTIQEFMLVPHGFSNFADALRAGAEVYQVLKKNLAAQKLATAVGDEGGFAPQVNGTEQALQFLQAAVEKAGYAGKISFALDAAANEFFTTGTYTVDGKPYTASALTDFYQTLVQKFGLVSIEDGLAEDDIAGWQTLTTTLGKTTQLVGDDLFVTNPQRFVQLGLGEKIGNAILIKPNQIGTLSDTLRVIETAQKNGFATVISHRSGESEDTTIADIAVGTGSTQIKTGAPARGERTAKYNRLLDIAHHHPALTLAKWGR